MKHGTIRSPSVSSAAVRQTVLGGAVDSNGFPSALSVGTGLAVALSAATTPFLLSFAAGFDSYGAVDYMAQITANTTIAVPASATSYLHADRDPTTGAITFGSSPMGTTYSTKAPASPTTGATWFDLATFLMKRWSGSAWVAIQRVILGEVLTGTNTVTSVTNYAYQGHYQSLWTSVVASTTYAFNHNIGIPLAAASALVGVWTSPTGSDADSIPDLSFLSLGGTDYGYQPFYPAVVAPWRVLSIGTKANPVLNTNNAWLTTGFLKLTVKRGW